MTTSIMVGSRQALLAAAVLALGCRVQRAGAPPPEPTPEVSPGVIEQGRLAYITYCALCHGPDAEGYAADHANALGNDDFLRVANDDFLRRAIEEGHPGTPMAAWHARAGGPLQDDMVAAIVAYLRSLGDGTAAGASTYRSEGDLELGGRLFSEHCASCHGASGEGATAVSLNSGVFQQSATDTFVRETIARGREGTPMQGFGRRFTTVELDAVTAFVRALAPRVAPPPPPPGPPPPPLDEITLHPDAPRAQFVARDDRFVPGAAVREALQSGQRMVLIDARAPSAWAEGHIPGAVPFPFYDADELIRHIPDRTTWVIAYCACPHAASGHVVDALRAAGHTRAAILDEGITWWQSQGFPMERGSVPTP